MEEKEKKNKIAELTEQIVGNAKDAHWMRNQVTELLRIQKQECDMNKIIDIPLSDIVEVIDFGACVLYKVKDGFVFEAKGGMITHVSLRMQSICTMLQTLFDLHAKEDKTEEDNTIYEAFSTAILYTFQCPIFSSLNEETLYSNATSILKHFNEYTKEHFDNAKNLTETEEDIKANNEAELIAKGLEILAESPLPPED